MDILILRIAFTTQDLLLGSGMFKFKFSIITLGNSFHCRKQACNRRL